MGFKMRQSFNTNSCYKVAFTIFNKSTPVVKVCLTSMLLSTVVLPLSSVRADTSLEELQARLERAQKENLKLKAEKIERENIIMKADALEQENQKLRSELGKDAKSASVQNHSAITSNKSTLEDYPDRKHVTQAKEVTENKLNNNSEQVAAEKNINKALSEIPVGDQRRQLVATAKNLIVKDSPSSPVVEQWRGAYIGINGGYGGGDIDTTVQSFTITSGVAGNPATASGNARAGGGLAGGQIGYNYTFDNKIFLGGELDVNWADISNRSSSNIAGAFAGPYFSNSNNRLGLRWLGTSRLRIGYNFGNLLAYFTGGLAFGGATFQTSLGTVQGLPAGFNIPAIGQAANESNSTISAGWAVGAGTEYKLAKNWSFKTDYLYSQIGAPSQNVVTYVSLGPQFGYSLGSSGPMGFHQVRAGLNYHPNFFMETAAPIAAKY
jgi:outer membrane immunogenic protein